MSTKVMTIVGTRPEIIKLSRVMVELDKNRERYTLREYRLDAQGSMGKRSYTVNHSGLSRFFQEASRSFSGLW
jgi:hypothetical protein